MSTTQTNCHYLCPNCRAPIEDDEQQIELTCANGHVIRRRGGVLTLLAKDFEEYLDQFSVAFRAYRADRKDPSLPTSAYAELPFGTAVQGNAEWRAQQTDLQLILARLPAQPSLRILDVGAWNGWLSHQLAQRGHHVTAVAYFDDERDGLGARQHYPNPTWQAIQMDEVDLDILCQSFDMVVLNRCVQFSPDPLAQVKKAQRRVSPGGQLIITGLGFYRDPSAQRSHLAALQQRFQQNHGLPLFLRPARGYLDSHDLRQLEALGLLIKPYANPVIAIAKSILRPTTPRACFAIWRNG